MRTRGGSSLTLQRLLLTGVADSSCPEQETGASRPQADARSRREACCWGCSSAGGDTRPFSGGTQRQRRRRRPQRSGRGPDLPSARGCSRSLQAPLPPPRRAGAPPKPRRPPLLGPLPGPAAPGIAAPPSPPASGLVRPPPLRSRRWRRRRPRRSSPRPPRLPERPAPSLRSASLPPPLRPFRARPPHPPPATQAGGAHARTRTDTQRANRRGGSAPLVRPLAVPHAAAHSVPSPTPPSNQSGNGSEGEREVSFPARPFSPLNGCVSRQSQSDLFPPLGVRLKLGAVGGAGVARTKRTFPGPARARAAPPCRLRAHLPP